MVLPDPTRPMMPTRSPPAILKETFSSAASLEPGYLNDTFSKAMLPFSMRRATYMRSGGRSRSSCMMRLMALSVMKVCAARVMTVAIPAIGASTRPASMVAATSTPTVILPSRMRKTPMMTISR